MKDSNECKIVETKPYTEKDIMLLKRFFRTFNSMMINK